MVAEATELWSSPSQWPASWVVMDCRSLAPNRPLEAKSWLKPLKTMSALMSEQRPFHCGRVTASTEVPSPSEEGQLASRKDITLLETALFSPTSVVSPISRAEKELQQGSPQAAKELVKMVRTSTSGMAE